MIPLSDKIISYIEKHFGKDYLRSYKEFYNSNYRTCIRISRRVDQKKLINNLKKYGIELEKIESVKNAYKVLTGENVVGKTFFFILGYYYIQSLSSMIPALILNPEENNKVLDLCAAPGSKTTQLSELMNGRGTLIANDISIDRVKVLMFNIDKMNLINVGVMNKKGEFLSRYFENYFDKILVDAPCSALGIVQKRGEVSTWWNINKLGVISDLQYKLLVSAIKMLKVGGEIVYSTCTLTLEENEMVLNKILKKYPIKVIDIRLPIQSVRAFTKLDNNNLDESLKNAKRILPWDVESEGFFIAKLIKTDETINGFDKINTSEKVELYNYSSNKVKDYLLRISDYYGIDRNIFESYLYIIRSKDLYFINNDWESIHTDLFNRIGSKFGSIDKKNIVQIHTSAAQILGKYSNKNVIELNNEKELEIYLNGGSIKGDFGKEGQKIVKYQEFVLGTGVSSNEGLKSQFPRALRTQEMII